MDVIIRLNNNPVNNMTALMIGFINDSDKVMKSMSNQCLLVLGGALVSAPVS